MSAGFAADTNVHLITPTSPGRVLQNVRLSHCTFNPSRGEEIGIYYQLNKDAMVTVRFYDPDRELVATLIDRLMRAKGENSVLWDGKDMDGQIVPDEAWCVIVEAEDEKGNREIYDPTIFCDGEEHDLTQGTIDAESGTINYRLPEMGRV
ncbi:MAG: hypothetical protein U9N38_05830, partial [Thermodesulfobacteriota bacterium]|nr:hypothetical protein [Thermodesulfobacteriota bacterium]